MSEKKPASKCLFIGGSLDGQIHPVVGEECSVPVVTDQDFDAGMMTYRKDLYLSKRYVPGKGQPVVKIMAIYGMTDAVLMSLLQDWTFTADGPVRKSGDESDS